MPAVFESNLSPHFRFNPCDLPRRTAYHIPAQAARRPWVYNPTTHSTVALPGAVADLGHQSQVQWCRSPQTLLWLRPLPGGLTFPRPHSALHCRAHSRAETPRTEYRDGQLRDLV